MKRIFQSAAKSSEKWLLAVILAVFTYIGTGLIPIFVFFKALTIRSAGLFFFVLLCGIVAAVCFHLLMRALINKLLFGVMTPLNVVINDKAE